MNKKNSTEPNEIRVYDAIIIGAGPAGLMAAIQSHTENILLLEKKDIPGKKLLISGKGRCNLTNNTLSVEDFLSNFSRSGQFLRNAFNVFFVTDLMDFFRKNHVPLKTERGNRVFPESNRSRDILDCFLKLLKTKKIPIKTNANVNDISTNQDGVFNIKTETETFLSRKVILTTGGLSYSLTGSTGEGLQFAKKLGHKIIPPKPALVGIETYNVDIKKWQGISLKNVTCTILKDGKKGSNDFGEMIFTHYGLSGPIILNLSANIYDLIQNNKKTEVSIDLKPALNIDKLNARLLREFEKSLNKQVIKIMKELLPGKMTSLFLEHINLDPKKTINQITKSERQKIVQNLKNLRFKIKKTRPIEEAIVTRGGISIKEINPKTMESKICKGLYFAGEIIDIDAKTGGYNLQAAFSTGYVAGKNI